MTDWQQNAWGEAANKSDQEQAMDRSHRQLSKPLLPPRTKKQPLLPEEVASKWAFQTLMAPLVRSALLATAVSSRNLQKWTMDVSIEGWLFPKPMELTSQSQAKPQITNQPNHDVPAKSKSYTRIKPPSDAVLIKERLYLLLQPPLEQGFNREHVHLPMKPFKYQFEGIAFLMPRHAALLADEMGLGKTMQTIISMRLLFHAGLIQNALLICPKPLVLNWCREIKLWAEDIPFEVITGDSDTRRCTWLHSNCPLKVINYEVLTRDADYLEEDQVQFDLVILDEAQRIKNHQSKTAQVVRQIKRQRAWALSGTPIENRPDDLCNLFQFIKPDLVPPHASVKELGVLTRDYILRRVKEDVLTDMPPKLVRDAYIELSAPQRQSYDLAEKEGIIHLNAMGETVTVQHVFELVMRLKQICNFDPLTGQSGKLEQLMADIAEVAESGRKAIIFSQWVEPLILLAEHLSEFGPLQFHGKIPSSQRPGILEQFQQDSAKHVLLMSYGTGSVGLNLQFANYVFLFDRWWNPAIEDQAINRAHRIGQKEPVFVTRFITPGTIEGRICEILERKRQLFNELLGQGGQPSLSLTEEELFGLFPLTVRPKRAAA